MQRAALRSHKEKSPKQINYLGLLRLAETEGFEHPIRVLMAYSSVLGTMSGYAVARLDRPV